MQFVITVYDGAGMLAKRMEVRNSAIREDPCSSCLRPPTAWIPSSWPYSSSVEVSAPSVPVLAGAWQDGRVSVSSVAFSLRQPSCFLPTSSYLWNNRMRRNELNGNRTCNNTRCTGSPRLAIWCLNASFTKPKCIIYEAQTHPSPPRSEGFLIA